MLALAGTALMGSDDPPPSAVERLGFKFNPVKEPAAQTTASAPAPDGTVVMPNVLVRESRAKPTEEDLMTPAEKLDQAKRENISPLYAVTFGPLSQLASYYFNWLGILGGWHPNDAEALVLHDQNIRLRKLREFDDMVDMVRLADPKQATELKNMRAELFRLQQDSDDTPMTVIVLQRGAKSHP